MEDEVTAYILDAGNTHVKLGYVKNGVIAQVKRFNMSTFPWGTLQGNIPVLISSVITDEWKRSLEDFFQNLVYIYHLYNNVQSFLLKLILVQLNLKAYIFF